MSLSLDAVLSPKQRHSILQSTAPLGVAHEATTDGETPTLCERAGGPVGHRSYPHTKHTWVSDSGRNSHSCEHSHPPSSATISAP